MGGGRSLYFSAPFGSFISQRLGFIGGSFNNKGSAFEMKSSCICVGRPLFFYFKMVISVPGVRTGERSREYTREIEESKRVRMLERENSKGTQERKVG